MGHASGMTIVFVDVMDGPTSIGSGIESMMLVHECHLQPKQKANTH